MKGRFAICFLSLLVVACLLSLFGCRGNSSDNQMRKATERSMREAQSQVGMPAIKNFQERKLAKLIFELRDQEKLICYAYIASWEGKLIFVGKCIGYGLPYSIQYTSPQKLEHMGTAGYNVMPQADPNGLFMPEGLSATWLMMIDPEGNPRPVYFEPQIVVSPFPLHDIRSRTRPSIADPGDLSTKPPTE